MFGFRVGEVIIIAIALLILTALPIVVGTIIFYGIRRAKNHRSAWQTLAAKLKMSVATPSGLGVSGTYKNRTVRVAVGIRRSGDSQETFTYCETEFKNGLRLLLNIETRGFLASVFASGGSVKLGNAAFDERFNAGCYDPQILKQLLLSEFPSVETANLMGDLLLAAGTDFIIRIDDSRVYLETTGDNVIEDRVLSLMDTAVRLGDRFDAARAAFPLAQWEILAFQNWDRTATALGLQFDKNRFCLTGSLRGFPLDVRVTSVAQKWQTTFRVAFPSNLSLGVQIFPENSIHRAMTWIGAQDVKTGFADFDNAFVVKARDEAAALMKLQPDVCQQLLQLQKITGDLKIDDEAVTVASQEVIGDGDKLKSYVQAVVAGAAMFWGR